MQHCVYLHIPKTAGTALKVLIKQGHRFFDVASTHQIILKDRHNVIFSVRDPWERFCSGFWEVKTLKLRHQRNMQLDNGVTNDFEQLESRYPSWYKSILSECNTPNDFCSLLQSDANLHKKLYNFDKQVRYHIHTPLGIVTQSITWWLGKIDEYKGLEDRVVRAINLKSLRRFMHNYFNITMPDDPFLIRSRKQFDTEQSYESSANNLDWFINHFRADDYNLIEYIKQRPYYYEK